MCFGGKPSAVSHHFFWFAKGKSDRIHQQKGRFLPGIWWESGIFPVEIGTFTIIPTSQNVFTSSFPPFPCRILAHRLELSSFFSVRPEPSRFSCGFFVQMSRIPQRFLCKNLIPPLLCNLTITDRETLSNLYQSFFVSLLQPDEKAGILDTVAMVKKITMLNDSPGHPGSAPYSLVFLSTSLQYRLNVRFSI